MAVKDRRSNRWEDREFESLWIEPRIRVGKSNHREKTSRVNAAEPAPATTQLMSARSGTITRSLSRVASDEGLEEKRLQSLVAQGRAVVLCNPLHPRLTPKGVGTSLSVKVNANIGTSPERIDMKSEIEKLNVAVGAGADTVMDLSTGGDLDSIRETIIDHCPVPVGTVPIYQAAIETVKRKKSITKMDPAHLFDVIEKHGQHGVDFITVHCGVTRETIGRLKSQGRIADIVSRGGAFLTEWMVVNERENPLYEEFERLLAIAKKYDMCLSLGDGLRPGCVADATDRAQIQELITLGELAAKAQEEGVQVMIEGPGHVPLNQIQANILLEKRLCNEAPFYVLGPIVTDIAPVMTISLPPSVGRLRASTAPTSSATSPRPSISAFRRPPMSAKGLS